MSSDGQNISMPESHREMMEQGVSMPGVKEAMEVADYFWRVDPLIQYYRRLKQPVVVYTTSDSTTPTVIL